MSSVTTNMTRILHRLLYFNLLNNNLINYMNKVNLSFDSTCFNIMVCLVTICTINSFSWGIVWVFWVDIILLFCGINRLFMTSTLKIPSSQTKATSLWCYKVSFFILVIVTCKYGCNLDLKTIVKKLSIVLCWRLLANFNNLS
jgi:hypothetical protein